MSKNFLVRQFLKAGGSFFVGASTAIGILGHTILNSAPALANTIYIKNLPSVAQDQVRNLINQDGGINTIAFAPNGGFVFLLADNKYYTYNISQDVINELATLNNKKSRINTIAFAPNGGWVIIFDDYGYSQHNVSQDVINELATQNRLKSNIRTVAFTANGGFVVIGNQRIYYTNNIPQDAIKELVTLSNQGVTFNTITIAFAPNGSWIILYGYNSYYGEIPQILQADVNQLAQIANYKSGQTITNIAFSPSNGLVLFYSPDSPSASVAKAQAVGIVGQGILNGLRY